MDVRALSMDHTVGRKKITAKAMLETVAWVYQSWRGKNRHGVAVRVLWKHQPFILIYLHFPFQFILIAPFCSQTEICFCATLWLRNISTKLSIQQFEDMLLATSYPCVVDCSPRKKILEIYEYVLSYGLCKRIVHVWESSRHK